MMTMWFVAQLGSHNVTPTAPLDAIALVKVYVTYRI